MKVSVVARYDKRMCSATETARFYSPGVAPLVFDVDGFRFGCLICIEINFPDLFMEYDRLGVDCVLLSAYPMAADDMFHTKALAHAAIHNVWIGLSVPTEGAELTASSVIGPNGHLVSTVSDSEGTAFGDLNRDDPAFDIALHKARPWRALGDKRRVPSRSHRPRRTQRQPDLHVAPGRSTLAAVADRRRARRDPTPARPIGTRRARLPPAGVCNECHRSSRFSARRTCSSRCASDN